ncbi:uncharacterized protein TrAFT101_001412 [Trichoderma asperellum]|uniref:uncharacterized protein n=1 Tax=Trichoderma asperellum TaxID=101201 RepID=UPI00331F5AE2|nr:hypothetical protein TrAFT101_001412 [Trichoderma asperellum]
MPLPAGGPYQQYEESTGSASRSATNTSQSRRPPFWTLSALHRADSRCEPRGWALGSGGAFSWPLVAVLLSRPFLGADALAAGCWLATAAASEASRGSGCDEQGTGSSISYQRLEESAETLGARGPARFASLAIAQAWPCRDLRQG